MEYMEFSAKTVSDAITEACQKFTVTSERLEYVVVSEGSSGFLGLGAKPAIIKARVKEEIAEKKAVKADEKVVAKVEATAEKKTETTAVNGTEVEEMTKTFLQDVFNAMNMTVNCKDTCYKPCNS